MTGKLQTEIDESHDKKLRPRPCSRTFFQGPRLTRCLKRWEQSVDSSSAWPGSHWTNLGEEPLRRTLIESVLHWKFQTEYEDVIPKGSTQNVHSFDFW